MRAQVSRPDAGLRRARPSRPASAHRRFRRPCRVGGDCGALCDSCPPVCGDSDFPRLFAEAIVDDKLSVDSFYALKLADGAANLWRKSPRYHPVVKIVLALASSRQRAVALVFASARGQVSPRGQVVETRQVRGEARCEVRCQVVSGGVGGS